MKNKLNKNYSKRKTFINRYNKNPFEYKDTKQNSTFHIYMGNKLDLDISKTINNFCNEKSKTIKNNRTPDSRNENENENKFFKKYKIPKKYNNIFRTKTLNEQFPKKMNASKTNYLNKKDYNCTNKNKEKFSIYNISKSNIFKMPKKNIKNMNSTLNNKKSHILSKKKCLKEGNTIISIRNKFLTENSKKILNKYSKSFIQIKTTKHLMKFDINKIYKSKGQIKEKDNTLDNARKHITLREKKNLTNSKLNLLKRIPKNYGSLLNKIVRNNIKKKNKNDVFAKRNENLSKFYTYKNEYENSLINQNSITHSRIKIKMSENNNRNINIKLSKNGNNNISSRQTIFSSYITSEKNVLSMIKSNDGSEEKNKKEKSLKNSNDINLESESNDVETKEYESKFLNYELGVSDKMSNNDYNLDNNKYKNNETIKNEYEKPIEEIEKIADQILNKSNYKDKHISFLQNILMNIKNNKDN
jgi:predicted hydrocarbon binding protein